MCICDNYFLVCFFLNYQTFFESRNILTSILYCKSHIRAKKKKKKKEKIHGCKSKYVNDCPFLKRWISIFRQITCMFANFQTCIRFIITNKFIQFWRNSLNYLLDSLINDVIICITNQGEMTMFATSNQQIQIHCIFKRGGGGDVSDQISYDYTHYK